MSLPRKRIAAIATAAVLVLVGCSGGNGDGNGNGGDGGNGNGGGNNDGGTTGAQPDPANPVAVTVGTLLAADYAPVFLAEQEGFYEEEGLDVTIETIAGGAVGVTQLVANEIQFAAATWTNVLSAASQGLELQVIRENTDSSKEGINGLIAKEGSGIETVDDLRGKTLSVNTLQSATELQVRDCLDSAGLGPDDYELVEVPFPEVGAAVSQGRIAAGFVPEPFITIGESEGLFPVLYGSTCNEDQARSPITNWITSTAYAEENPAVVAAFARAVDKATQMIIDDPQVLVDILPTYTTLSEELAAAITHPPFRSDGTPDVEGGQRIADLMYEWGLIDEPLEDVSPYAWQGE